MPKNPKKTKTPQAPRNDASSSAKAIRANAAAIPGRLATPSLLRIPSTADVLSPVDQRQSDLFNQRRVQSATHFFLALNQTKDHLAILAKALTARALPDHLVATLQEPDGSAAVRVQVQFDPASVGANGPVVSALCDDHGTFVLPLPSGSSFPPSNALSLTIHGANANTTMNLSADNIAANGLAGNIRLDAQIQPLNLSIIASLQALLPTPQPGTGGQPAPAPSQPTITLGESGPCQVRYRTDYSEDRFPYSVFVRLIEPRTSIVTNVFRFPLRGQNFIPLTQFAGQNITFNAEQQSFVDRVPVGQPISVDGFRDQINGVTTINGVPVISADETVPMAGTLGLGYIVTLAQKWTPQGLTLGNLVYSLPLAPGEQQRVALFERRDLSEVRESELLTEDELRTLSEQDDTSSNATFTSAFGEMVRAGSQFETQASSASWGASIIIASGGGGYSNSSGSSSSWLDGQRNSVQRAAEDTHASTQRQAAARRSAFRTGMRTASASESQQLTTKVITNHNHTHALTLQYWEVQRLFKVGTDVEGVTLTCLVPLEVVRFLPAGQLLTISDPTEVDSRPKVLNRYALVLKHADVLARTLPRPFQHGLTLLRQFASDPTADVAPAAGAAEDVIAFQLSGTFLPFERIYVSAVTRRGTRIGPVMLSGLIPPVPDVHNDLKNSFPTKDALVAFLRGLRAGSFTTLSGNLALPPSLARNDVIGFEITRNFRPFDYDLVNQQVLTSLVLGLPFTITDTSQFVSSSVHFNPNDLESLLGGPNVTNFVAQILTLDAGGSLSAPQETYANDNLNGVELPPAPYPVPALQLSPVLRYSQVLEIENMLQHVINNTVSYSKAVWWSLTAEERVIMLEGYTIGVPTGGVIDDTQMVPLLNCIENRLLGFFGNSMIFPFMIPRSVADSVGITSAQVQDMLTQFHKNSFDPPQDLIALPTRGVLGEAVLGHCSSAEKIDLTRFWNWQDSPADAATDIASPVLPTTTPLLTAGQTAPSALATIPPLINNFSTTGVSPDTSLIAALAKTAAQPDFSTAFTGADQLSTLIQGSQKTAESARADALKTTKDLTAQVIATAGNIVGGIYGGNPTAGSSALAAQNGKDPSSSDGGDSSGKTAKDSKGSKDGKGSGGSDSGGSGSGSSGSGSGSGSSGSGGSGGSGSGSGGSGSGSGPGSGSGAGSGGSGSSGGSNG